MLPTLPGVALAPTTATECGLEDRVEGVAEAGHGAWLLGRLAMHPASWRGVQPPESVSTQLRSSDLAGLTARARHGRQRSLRRQFLAVDLLDALAVERGDRVAEAVAADQRLAGLDLQVALVQRGA